MKCRVTGPLARGVHIGVAAACLVGSAVSLAFGREHTQDALGVLGLLTLAAQVWAWWTSAPSKEPPR